MLVKKQKKISLEGSDKRYFFSHLECHIRSQMTLAWTAKYVQIQSESKNVLSSEVVIKTKNAYIARSITRSSTKSRVFFRSSPANRRHYLLHFLRRSHLNNVEFIMSSFFIAFVCSLWCPISTELSIQALFWIEASLPPLFFIEQQK